MSSSSYGQPGTSAGNDERLGTRMKDRPFTEETPGSDDGSHSAAAMAAGLGGGADQFGRVLSDLQDLVARAGNVSGEDLAQLRTQIAEKFSDAREKVGELTEEAAAATRKGADATEEMIRAHPFPAVAVAVAAGLVIGLLLARR